MAFMHAGEEVTISGRLRDALVSYLVVDDPENDYYLRQRLRDPHDWTEHLGRQLGIDTYSAVGIHDTLMVLIPELDDHLKVNWPPRQDLAWCRGLATAATKHLTPLETYTTLFAGPKGWRREHIDDCMVDRLYAHLRVVLERCLAGEINRVLGDWIKWDVPRLAQRRRAAIEQAERAEAVARLAARPKVQKRIPPPPDRPGPDAYFQPPGRT